MVQGHVDQTGTCIEAQETNGSWYYTFEYDEALNNLTIEKVHCQRSKSYSSKLKEKSI
jgi:riboflavin synthase alpha subunit